MCDFDVIIQYLQEVFALKSTSCHAPLFFRFMSHCLAKPNESDKSYKNLPFFGVGSTIV